MSSPAFPESLWLDQVPFEEALKLQMRLHEEVKKAGPGLILGLQHPAVITLGLRGEASKDLRSDSEVLPLPVHRIDRGGQATLHSPGQLVIYPILPFQRMGLTPRDYVCLLLKTTCEFFRDLGLDAQVSEEKAGVFTPRGKIAFCGLRLSQGVSRHGLSLNISNDLSLFRWIRPCGISEEPLTSLALEDHVQDGEMPVLFRRWVQHFQRNMRRVTACSESSLRTP